MEVVTYTEKAHDARARRGAGAQRRVGERAALGRRRAGRAAARRQRAAAARRRRRRLRARPRGRAHGYVPLTRICISVHLVYFSARLEASKIKTH